MKGLSVVGTAAMFIVGGSILVHGIPGSHDLLHHAEVLAHRVSATGTVLVVIIPTLINGVTSIIAGVILVAALNFIKNLNKK